MKNYRPSRSKSQDSLAGADDGQASQHEDQGRHKRKAEKPSAKRKVMDLLARRDHSAKELKQKLYRFEYEETEIDEALSFALENGWMKPETELAETFARQLHRRNKGQQYINKSLQQKGLPPVSVDRDYELEKALILLKNKYGNSEGELPSDLDQKEKARIGRFLMARGFDSDIIRKVLYEEL